MTDEACLATLFIDEPTGLPRPGEVILGGVPLPRGALAQGGFFRLRSADGRDFTIEGTTAARWPDGTVKWLHLCGPVDLQPGRNHFQIIPGAPPAARPEAPSDGTSDLEAAFERGALRLAPAADRLLSITFNGQEVLRAPGLSAQMILADADGTRRAALPWTPDPDGPRRIVGGANRVVFRWTGHFVELGRVVGEMVLFIEALRHAPRVALQPVCIYLGDPDRDLVAALTLTIHTAFGGDETRYAFANERGPGYRDVLQPVPQGPTWPFARQVQLGSSFYATEKRATRAGSWVKAVEGRRSQGWCHLAGPKGGVTAAMRYFWQEYPRSLSLDAVAGDVTFGLIPPEATPLDLRRYSPTRWGPVMYEHLEGPFPAQTHGATGIAKASELMLHFHTSPEENPAEAALRFVRPARLIPASEDLARSRVLGALAPALAAGHEALESEVAALADFLVRERDVRGWYGLMNFGDVMIAFYSDKDCWAFDDGGYAWLNTEAVPDLGLWLAALRHGRRDWLDAAVEMTRHNRDVDTYHRGNFRGNGTRHNVNHWGCNDKEWRVVMPLARRLHYYLTADPWTREVILNTVSAWQTYERTASSAPSITSALSGILVKHELTNDPADEAVLRRMADLYARAVRPDGHFVKSVHVNLATGEGDPVEDGQTMDGRYFFLNLFGGQHALVELAELLDHRPLIEAAARFADRCIAEEAAANAYGGVDRAAHTAHPADAVLFIALALRATGQARYRDALRAFLAAPHPPRLETVGGTGPFDEPPHLALAGVRRRNKVACDIGRVLHLTPYALAPFVREEETPQ